MKLRPLFIWLLIGCAYLFLTACDKPDPQVSTPEILMLSIDIEDHVLHYNDEWHSWDAVLQCNTTWIGLEYDIPSQLITLIYCDDSRIIDVSSIEIEHEACAVVFEVREGVPEEQHRRILISLPEEVQYCIFDTNDWLEMRFSYY